VLAVHLPIEWPTAVAHPANDLRRHAGDERVRRDIFRNNRTGGDHRVAADCNAAQDGGVRAYGGAVVDLR